MMGFPTSLTVLSIGEIVRLAMIFPGLFDIALNRCTLLLRAVIGPESCIPGDQADIDPIWSLIGNLEQVFPTVFTMQRAADTLPGLQVFLYRHIA